MSELSKDDVLYFGTALDQAQFKSLEVWFRKRNDGNYSAEQLMLLNILTGLGKVKRVQETLEKITVYRSGLDKEQLCAMLKQ